MARIAMSDLVAPEWIIEGLEVADSEAAIRAMCRFFAARSGLGQGAVRNAVSRRADLTTFGLGAGIAVPHGTVAGLARPRAAFARLTTPVSFDAADGRPADLVVLLLAPEGDEVGLLRALSCLARRMRAVADTVRRARCAEALHVVLTTDLWSTKPMSDARPLAPVADDRPLPSAGPPPRDCRLRGGEVAPPA